MRVGRFMDISANFTSFNFRFWLTAYFYFLLFDDGNFSTISQVNLSAGYYFITLV